MDTSAQDADGSRDNGKSHYDASDLHLRVIAIFVLLAVRALSLPLPLSLSFACRLDSRIDTLLIPAAAFATLPSQTSAVGALLPVIVKRSYSKHSKSTVKTTIAPLFFDFTSEWMRGMHGILVCLPLQLLHDVTAAQYMNAGMDSSEIAQDT